MKGLDEIENSLRDMQNFIGGYIEDETILQDPEVVLVCDEEGVLNNRALNPSLPDLDEYGGLLGSGFVLGDCFLCGADGEKFADIPDKWESILLKLAKEAYRENRK